METKNSLDCDSSSSSSLKRRRIPVEDGNSNIYDVFISFRGEDTRTDFTSHVYAALSRKQIKAFIDSKDLRTGNEISGSLLKAIEASKLYLVIFSPNYGSSRWCLLELEKILLCSKQHGKMVVPVFYKVDPSHVRYQTGSFGDAFASKHEGKEEKEKVINWRAALKEAADLVGLQLNDHKLESEFIDDIVAAILRELKQMLPLSNRSEILVGINQHIEKIECLLRKNSKVVYSVGIWGMGGIGKTTIAKSVFGRIGRQFDGYCFFEDIRGHGKDAFWSKFDYEGFERKKVFIVYDGVDDWIFSKIPELAKHNRFAEGSKILVTSRDRNVFKKMKVNEVYEVVGLKNEEALKLFSLMAFEKEFPSMRYLELSSRVVRSTQGNPLALRALGMHFIDRDDEKYWHSELEKIERIYNKLILELLKISYDGLQLNEKELFLDIVCFFKGEDKDHVENLLNEFYHRVYSSMTHLIEKSLISISLEGKIEIHDLMQEMGLEMVNEEENRGKCKRLCNSTDIYRVLIGKTGTETIQGINLNLSEGKNMSFELDVFSKMVNLRWLKVYGRNDDQDVRFSDTQGMIDFQWLMRVFKRNQEVSLPRLRYLCWEEFPLKSLPSIFNAQNLVKLSLPGSKVEQLWTGIQDVVNLRWMDLSGSRYLTEIPDMSKAKNIEHMILDRCCSLTRLDPSVQHLSKLEVLNLSYCSNLSEIPSKLESKVLEKFELRSCNKIRKFPEICGDELRWLSLTTSKTEEFLDLLKFVNLRILCLHDCLNITKFSKIPNNLKSLYVSGIGIEEVPSSLLESLTKLERLWLRDNKKLTSISSSISKLESLRELLIYRCGLLSYIPELPPSLQLLDVQHCPSLEKISVPIINNCSQLTIVSCPKLVDESRSDIRKHFFSKLQLGKGMTTRIEGSEIPEEFLPPETTKAVCVGSSVTLQLSLELNGNYSVTSFAVWAAVEFETTNLFRPSRPPLSLKFRILVHSQLGNGDGDDLAVQMETPLLDELRPYLLRPSHQLVLRSFSLDSYTCQQIREILSGYGHVAGGIQHSHQERYPYEECELHGIIEASEFDYPLYEQGGLHLDVIPAQRLLLSPEQWILIDTILNNVEVF